MMFKRIHLQTDRSPTSKSGLAKVAIQCPANRFVVNQTLILRTNIYCKNRHLRLAQNVMQHHRQVCTE